MLKRVAAVWLALVLMTGSMAMAATERPDSMDRHMAPDDYPTNVVKILRTTNKAQTNSYVPVVFTMTRNNPYNVIRHLRRPAQQEEGLLFTFVNPDGNGGKVLYCVPKYMIPYLDQLVKSLDVPGLTTSSGDVESYIQLKHRRADASDSDFVDTAASFTLGDFVVDPENNAFYLYDTPSARDALHYGLETWLDNPTAMVQLLVKIYELDAYNDGTLGLDYMDWKNTIGSDLFRLQVYDEHGRIERLGSTVGEPLGTGASRVPTQSFTASGYNYAYNYKVTSEFFDFLQTKGKARLLNQSKLAALNTYKARLSAGDQIIYYSVDTSSGRTVTAQSTAPEKNNLTYCSKCGYNHESSIGCDPNAIETGLKLSFVPTIGEESVTLDIKLSWSDYTGFDSSGFPQVNPRSLKTRTRLGIGEETVIGGLNRQVRVSNTEKIPILGSLPVIGFLFGGETEVNKNTEMIVAIQPIGIMNYQMARGKMVGADDDAVIRKATGEASETELPTSTWGFDMYGLDSAGMMETIQP